MMRSLIFCAFLFVMVISGCYLPPSYAVPPPDYFKLMQDLQEKFQANLPKRPIPADNLPVEVENETHNKLPENANGGPLLKPSTVAIIDAPIVCPSGQLLDHKGKCRLVYQF